MVPFRVECPAIFEGVETGVQRPIEFTYVRFYDLKASRTASAALTMTAATLQRLVKTHLRPTDYLYVNMGHGSTYGDVSDSEIQQTAVYALKAAYHVRLPDGCTAWPQGTRVFMASHPPQHFKGSSTGEYRSHFFRR